MNESNTMQKITRLPLWKLEQRMREAKMKYDATERLFRDAEKEFWRVRDEVEQARKSNSVWGD